MEFMKTSTNHWCEKENKTNLLRYLKFIENEIPENEREEFLNVIENEFSDKSFDFQKYKDKFNFEKYGTNVIKALYIWNPEENIKTTKSYKDFYSRVEESIIDVDLFLMNLASSSKTDNDESESWFDNIK